MPIIRKKEYRKTKQQQSKILIVHILIRGGWLQYGKKTAGGERETPEALSGK